MAGLVPAIHVFPAKSHEGVEARHKAGHDAGARSPRIHRDSFVPIDVYLNVAIGGVLTGLVYGQIGRASCRERV